MANEKNPVEEQTPVPVAEQSPEKKQKEVKVKKSSIFVRGRRWLDAIDTRSKLMIFVFLLVLFGGQIAIFYTFNKEVKTQQSLIDQLQADATGQHDLVDKLQKHESKIETLSKAFPNEVGLSNFVKVVDQYLRVYGNGKFQFDSKEPIPIENTKMVFLPITISASASVDQVEAFLSNLANSPYLFQPLSLQLANDRTQEGQYRFILKGRLYVDETLQ